MTHARLDEELKRIDKRLSCTFNGLKLRYEVNGIDSRGKKYLLYEIPLGQLDFYANQVLEGVRKAKFFTAKEKNRMLDETEEREERQKDRKLEDDIDHVTAESYDVFKRLEGQRITILDCGFEVRDKRRVSPEPVSV